MPRELAIEPVDLEVRHSERPTSGVYELWTRHSIYRLDEELRCVEVDSSDDGTPKPNHACEGATLQGGHTKVDGRVKTIPHLPPPGSHAIFSDRHDTVVVTSPLLRVVKSIPRGA